MDPTVLQRVREPTLLQPLIVEPVRAHSPALRLDMTKYMILVLSLRPVQSPVFFGAFELAADSLPDVDVLDTIRCVVLDVQLHGTVPNSISFDP